jgi:hypothetical protein
MASVDYWEVEMLKHVSAAIAVAALALAPSALAQVGAVEITPEEQAYQARTDARIRSWIHEENHEVSEEERTFINDHWRRAAKLHRIRHLAMQAKDMATVARVDALITRLDNVLEIQLGRMRMRAPIMTVAPSAIDVTTAPPPDQVENQGAAPPGQVWVKGYWHWNGARHVWQGGHWAPPPQPGMIYEPARWESRNGHYFFNDGRWRVAAVASPVVYEPPPPPAQVLEVQTAPPAPLVEVRPAGPRGGVWIPGFWRWNGARHEWIGGHWSAARVGMRWEPDHWVRTPAGWRMEHGRWAR